MADPICRWRNPYKDTIVELVKVLPHEVMTSDKFRKIVEERWPGFFRTPYQLACQVGLYYESDEGIYYPRFDHDIDDAEALSYMKRWITRYYVPNPYTKSMKTLQQPLPFLASIIGYIYEHPNEKELHSILENVFQENIGNIDIISNVLNTYTDLMIVDTNGNVELTDNAKDYMKKFIDRNDKKAFFENFSEEVIETKKEKLLRQASAATFLREALKVVIKEDSNLSKLAAVNKYVESKKSLKINGFRLWRMKDDLPLRLDDVYMDLEIEYNHQAYVMYLEWTPADMERMFFPVFNSAYNGMFAMAKEGNEYVLYKISEYRKGKTINRPLQKIYYGAPGTGKSNEIKDLTGKGKDGFMFSNDFTFRTTFHPDSDYSSFLGAYKPIWDEGKGKIVYEFRPQTFLKAYVAAWTNPNENVALVIEEINRGNCAQIFGDIFQLLDRESNGLSKYPIESDVDMQKFLSSTFSLSLADKISENDKDEINEYYSNHYDDAFSKIEKGEILSLPKNLSILATMNTSDQSLFPMDSAFKRRWEWQYMPIVDAKKNWKIHLADKYNNIDWWNFLDRINKVIADLTTSEDKKLGYFFCQPDEYVNPKHDPKDEPDLISAKRFVDKVIFYLWNDVFKDYAFDAKCCKNSEGKEVLFAEFFSKDGKSVNIETLKQFFETLTVENEPSLVVLEPSAVTSAAEEGSATEAPSAGEEPSSTEEEREEAETSTTPTTEE